MPAFYKPIKTVIISAVILLGSQMANSQSLSDKEIKINVAPIEHPLKSILQLDPKTFEYDLENYKHLHLYQGKQYGFMAENMQAVFPTMVSTKHHQYMFGKNVYRSAVTNQVNDKSLVPVLVGAIKELHAAIENLQHEVERLKAK